MNQSMSIRVLRTSDLATLRAVLALFGEAFDDREAYLTKQPTDQYLQNLLSSETFIAIAALSESGVIGGLAGYVLPKFEQERSEFCIYDLAVADMMHFDIAPPTGAARRRPGVA